MTSQEVNLIKTSFARIEPIAETAAALFYERLFELDPGLRRLFSGDMNEQGRKLMQMIAVAVKGLDRLDQLIPAVQALGARHSGYGVQDQHYETVGTTLLWTLEKGLGADFTAETREAWIKVYSVLSQTMKNAIRRPAENLAVIV
jgi:hemoglobin-like flavoprotein